MSKKCKKVQEKHRNRNRKYSLTTAFHLKNKKIPIKSGDKRCFAINK